MTSTTARTIVNVALVSAGAAAAWAVLRDPRGRRVAARLARIWLGASVPAYLIAETRRAWMESGRGAPDIMAR